MNGDQGNFRQVVRWRCQLTASELVLHTDGGPVDVLAELQAGTTEGIPEQHALLAVGGAEHAKKNISTDSRFQNYKRGGGADM